MKVSKEEILHIAKLAKLNLKEEEVDTLGISATPTIIFYTNGKEETTSARIEGNVSEEKDVCRYGKRNFYRRW